VVVFGVMCVCARGVRVVVCTHRQADEVNAVVPSQVVQQVPCILGKQARAEQRNKAKVRLDPVVR
jgi:hypothetical protein